MTVGARYALYYAPEPASRLWEFGSSVIGYDAETGEDLQQPRLPGIGPGDLFERTADPRQYGFHATLKPPFSLSDDLSVDQLLVAAHDFAETQPSFIIPALQVSTIGAFVALVPANPSAELHSLADDCVRAFEPFRAPLSEADRARRLKSPLTERQIAHLDAWGYPYVFEEFRFHMTLTGRLHHDERDTFRAALTDLYRDIAAPVTVGSIAIYQQPARDRRFSVLARFPLGLAALQAGRL